jgi:hypothetical protein
MYFFQSRNFSTVGHFVLVLFCVDLFCAMGRFELGPFCALGCCVGRFVLSRFELGPFFAWPFHDGTFCMCFVKKSFQG